MNFKYLSILFVCLPLATPAFEYQVIEGGTDSWGILLSDDGATAIVNSYSLLDQESEVSIWSMAEGLHSLTLPGHIRSNISFLTSDGLMAAGTSCASDTACEAYVWTASGGLQGLGFLPGDTWSDSDGANPSRDSGVVVGRSCPSVFQTDYCRTFIWTAAGGKREIATLPGKTESRVIKISADGSTLIGYSCNRVSLNYTECEAFRYDVATDSIFGLGLLPGYSQSTPNGISADNAAISVQACDSTGYMQCQAAIWTATDALQGLGFLPGDTFSLAWDVSSDGSTAVGSSGLGVNSERRPYVWTAEDGIQALARLNSTDRVLWVSSTGATIIGDTSGAAGNGAVVWTAPDWNIQALILPGDTYSSPRLATDAVVIGESGAEIGGAVHSQPYRWTPSGGLEGLGLLPGFQKAIAIDASADGSIVVGWQDTSDYSIEEAFVWSTTSGLEGLGFLPGDLYSFASEVSADGNIVLGASCDDSQCQAVLWTLSQPNAVTTPPGSGVSVDPIVTLPGGTTTSTVELTFDSVGTSGTTTVTAASSPGDGATQSPPEFKAGNPPVYYDVDTTATFTGTVELCFSWQEGQFINEGAIKLFHYEDDVWQDVTTSLDTEINQVCGQVTSFSPFALFETSYAFTGFFPPVDNVPIRNTAKAGSAIPVKFSLNGNQGLAIFDAGYPKSQALTCTTGSADAIEQTVNAGASALSYDASLDQYTYVWKTDKTWANSCRRLLVQFNDGSLHTADFGFVK